MEWLAQSWARLKLDDDALAPHRDGICLRLCWLGSMALLPFVLLHAVRGHWVMLPVTAALAAVTAANAWSLQRGRGPALPFWLLCVLVIGGVCTSVQLQGYYGVLWAFPGTFLMFFVLPRRQATALAALLLVLVTASAAMSLGLPAAARVLISLGFTLVMIHVVLDVLGRMQQALVEQAITDPLTGAYNRRHLQARLVGHVTAPALAADTTALLMIDVDHFKRINDRHGHGTGDTVLCRLVTTVRARKRSSDLLFRTGGEEFVLLLPQTTPEAALRVAEDLRLRLAEAELLPGHPVTVSIGVSALAPGQTVEAWVSAADRALYQAKDTGRNRVVLAAG